MIVIIIIIIINSLSTRAPIVVGLESFHWCLPLVGLHNNQLRDTIYQELETTSRLF